MVITSKDNKKIKDLRKLNEKKYRDKEKKFLVEGMHLVKEAYKTGNLIEVILVEEENIDISKTFVTKEVMKSISSLKTPYNIVGVCKMKEAKEIKNKVLILDGVQDPGNVGSIIRSALAFNIDTVIVNEECADIYSSKVLRASQGMIFNINIIKKDIKKAINDLKKKGFNIYGTNVEKGKEIKYIKNSLKYAIIMGNEGKGVKKEIQDLCDDNIYINMNNSCESLNVAVATSIILYELNK